MVILMILIFIFKSHSFISILSLTIWDNLLIMMILMILISKSPIPGWAFPPRSHSLKRLFPPSWRFGFLPRYSVPSSSSSWLSSSASSLANYAHYCPGHRNSKEMRKQQRHHCVIIRRPDQQHPKNRETFSKRLFCWYGKKYSPRNCGWFPPISSTNLGDILQNRIMAQHCMLPL